MYQNQIKPFALYINNTRYARYRHISDAEGMAMTLHRQNPQRIIEVRWDDGNVNFLLMRFNFYYV